MDSEIPPADERPLSAREARSVRQHYAAEREKQLLAEARAVAGPEGKR